MNENAYMNWLNNKNLEHLEDVRFYVDLHARQNNDSRVDFSCAKATVEMYLDDSELAEVFEAYR